MTKKILLIAVFLFLTISKVSFGNSAASRKAESSGDSSSGKGTASRKAEPSGDSSSGKGTASRKAEPSGDSSWGNNIASRRAELGRDDLSGQTSPAKQDTCAFTCFAMSQGESKAKISLTGRVIICVRNTLNIMFSDQCQSKNILGFIKDNLKNVVYAALTLFVVLLGYKITTTGQFSKEEFFTAILKFAFVIYFAIGTGLNDIVYKGGMTAMSSLSNFLMQAASTNGFCSFPEDVYNGGFKYLSMWDSIDCRISHYLFIGVTSAGGVVGGALFFGIFTLIIPLIFSLNIILGIFILIFGIFIVSIAASILHFFILAMIGLALMTYLGVIFVPMILFSYTKGFFDKWWQTTLSFAIQPVVMSAFISFPFLVFDNVMYDGCEYKGERWVISDARCESSIGWRLGKIFTDPSGALKTIHGFFFDFTQTYGASFVGLFTVLLKGVLFCYIFMKFAERGGDFASQLAGGPQIGKFAIGASEVIGGLVNGLKEKLSKSYGDVEGKSDGGEDKGVADSGKADRKGIDVSSK
jgi:type IV secretory pathway VirB6-like protein